MYVYVGMCSDVPGFPYKEVRNRFKFLSLLTSKEAIEALNHVRAECGRVAYMHLFHHSGVTKHLRLEEFQQAQSQATMMVHMYYTYVYVYMYACIYNTFLLSCRISLPQQQMDQCSSQFLSDRTTLYQLSHPIAKSL